MLVNSPTPCRQPTPCLCTHACACATNRYGIVTAALNFGTTIFPLIVAAIYTASDSEYLPNTEYLFIGLAGLSFLLGVWLFAVDWRKGRELTRSHWNDNAHSEDDDAVRAAGKGGGRSLVMCAQWIECPPMVLRPVHTVVVASVCVGLVIVTGRGEADRQGGPPHAVDHAHLHLPIDGGYPPKHSHTWWLHTTNTRTASLTASHFASVLRAVSACVCCRACMVCRCFALFG